MTDDSKDRLFAWREPDNDQESGPGWRPVRIEASPICCALHVEWIGAFPVGENLEAAQRELRRIARELIEVLQDWGICLPVVVAATARAADRPFMDALQAWASDQEWSRGEFVLLPGDETVASSGLSDWLNPRWSIITEGEGPVVKSSDELSRDLRGRYPRDLVDAVEEALERNDGSLERWANAQMARAHGTAGEK